MAARSRSTLALMLPRHLVAWLALLLLAVGNGALREATYGRRMTELHAHHLSTLAAVVVTGLAMAALARRWPLAGAREAWTVGIAWLLLTVAFELAFGRLVVGHSWARLLHDYDLRAGRVWPLFLAWILVGPRLFLALSGAAP